MEVLHMNWMNQHSFWDTIKQAEPNSFLNIQTIFNNRLHFTNRFYWGRMCNIRCKEIENTVQQWKMIE